jgi:restriction system protein
MAKRKRKRKNTTFDLINALAGFISIALFFMIFEQSKNVFGSMILSFSIYISLLTSITWYIKSKKNKRLKESGILEIDTMDGIQFEHYLKLLFQSQNYSVIGTPASSDFGADLVIEREGKKIVVQAKRYSKNVGIDAIQQVIGSVSHYKADEAWVITNRDFTAAAYTLAESNNVKLINRDQFIDMVLKMNPQALPSPEKVKADIPSQKVICKRCGSDMVLRKGPKGTFYGCTSFPKCRNTLPI